MADTETVRHPGMFAPLRHVAFKRIWLASLPFNFGLMIIGVGAGWAMTELSGQAQQVALVQAALNSPYMLFALPAGAISDTYDRRVVGIGAISAAISVSSMLVMSTLSGWLTPATLLGWCFLIGSANAMFSPVWQSSAGELVPAEDLPQGIALNSVSFNIARSFGPAVGGLLVAYWGALAAFIANALCYCPMLITQLLWKRQREVPRLPPEHAATAILSGIRYVAHSPPIRTALIRAILVGIAGASITSLMPLVARDLLHGGPRVYGLLLGTFGMGAVIGATFIPKLRLHFRLEAHSSISLAIVGVTVLILAFIRVAWLAYPVLLLAGAAWMQVLNNFSVTVQTRAPRWVTGRAVASYQACMAGGLAFGSALWGAVAEAIGTQGGVALSGVALLLCVGSGWWLPMADLASDIKDESAALDEPERELALTGRSGPVVVIIEYQVTSDHARQFYDSMIEVRRIRQRNGAYGWSLGCDIARPTLWEERFHCPTWHDYLRQRGRMTAYEQQVIKEAAGKTGVAQQVSVRRLLERPFGSVRWSAETPDRGDHLD